jgi:hypothetical protein
MARTMSKCDRRSESAHSTFCRAPQMASRQRFFRLVSAATIDLPGVLINIVVEYVYFKGTKAFVFFRGVSITKALSLSDGTYVVAESGWLPSPNLRTIDCNGQYICTLGHHIGPIQDLAVLSDTCADRQDLIFSLGHDYTVCMWSRLRHLQTWHLPELVPLSLTVTHAHVYVCCLPNLLLILRYRELNASFRQVEVGGSVKKLLVLPNGNLLCAFYSPSMKILTSEGETIQTLAPHQGWLRNVLVLADGRIVSNSAHGLIQVVEVWSMAGQHITCQETRRELNNFTLLRDGSVVCTDDVGRLSRMIVRKSGQVSLEVIRSDWGVPHFLHCWHLSATTDGCLLARCNDAQVLKKFY